jgi:hypothetical protein
MVVAFAARLVVVAASAVVTSGYLIPDEQQYVAMGQAVVRGVPLDQWYPGYGQSLYDATRTFSGSLVLMFDLFGATRLSGQLLAAVVGTAAAGVTVAVALRFLHPPYALAAGLVVAITPSQVLFSAVVLREAHVWLALAVVAWGFVQFASTDWRRLAGGSAIVAAGLLALAFLRQQTMLAAVWALVLAVVFTPRQRWMPRVAAGLAIAAIVPLVGGKGVGGWHLLASAVPQLESVRATLAVGANSAFEPAQAGADVVVAAAATPAAAAAEPPAPAATAAPAPTPASAPAAEPEPAAAAAAAAEAAAEQAAAAASAPPPAPAPGTTEADAEAVAPSLGRLPRGLVDVTVRPFPWTPTSGIGLALARVENLGWYALYVLAALGIATSLRRRAARVALQFPFLVTGMLVGMAALTQGNLGTAFRHRDQVLGALALCAAAGLQWIVPRIAVTLRRWRPRPSSTRPRDGCSSQIGARLRGCPEAHDAPVS